MAKERGGPPTPSIVDSPFSIDHSPLLLILADDLTGAADCAARCRAAGLPATIFLRPPGAAPLPQAAPLPAGAVAFTTDSRHLAPEAAAQRVRAVVDSLGQVARALWYKKIDSTLRGNLGSELDAMLDGLAAVHALAPCAVISPAFPAQARGLEDGYLVHAQTPARALHLPSLLASQSRRAVAAVALADVRQGREHLGATLAALHAAGHGLLAVDALSEADLETVFVAARQALPAVLFCGSAGLVGVIASHLATRVAPALALLPSEETPIRRVLVVVGSGSEMAHRQLARLRQEPAVRMVQVDGETEPEFMAGAAADARCVALHLPRPSPGTALEGEAARHLAEHLAQAAVAFLTRQPVDVLVLVGGDTAMGVLASLGIDQLAVVRELLPGMPLALARVADGARIRVILKAGNHGDDGTLVTLAHNSFSFSFS